MDADNAISNELNKILEQLHINDLCELRDIQRSNEIPTFGKIKSELQPFFQYKNKASSIGQQDIEWVQIINEAINAKEEFKEEEPSPYNNAKDPMVNNYDNDQLTQKPAIENRQSVAMTTPQKISLQLMKLMSYGIAAGLIMRTPYLSKIIPRYSNMSKVSIPVIVEVSRTVFQFYAAYRSINILRKLKHDDLFDIKKEATDDMKDILWKQMYFDIFDLLYELKKSNKDWTSLTHHTVVITMCQFALKHPNADKGTILMIICAIANQFGAIGFNVYKLLKLMNIKGKTQGIVKFSLILQVFYRFPIVCWIAMYQFLMIKKRGIKPQVDAFMITINAIAIFIDYEWIKWSLNKLNLKHKTHLNSTMLVSIAFAWIIGRKMFK